MSDARAKMERLAEILEGRVVDDTGRVEVCVKGAILGFPATLEAFRAGFPFGVAYYIETNADGMRKESQDSLTMTITPRQARGLTAVFMRLLLFEPRGQKIGERDFDSRYISSFDNFHQAERFVRYPEVATCIKKLYEYTSFGELVVRTDAGICLNQSKSFNALDLDRARETFKLLGQLGQVIFEAF